MRGSQNTLVNTQDSFLACETFPEAFCGGQHRAEFLCSLHNPQQQRLQAVSWGRFLHSHWSVAGAAGQARPGQARPVPGFLHLQVPTTAPSSSLAFPCPVWSKWSSFLSCLGSCCSSAQPPLPLEIFIETKLCSLEAYLDPFLESQALYRRIKAVLWCSLF